MKKNKKQNNPTLLDILYDHQNTKYVNKQWESTKNLIFYGLLYNLFSNNKNNKNGGANDE